MRARKESQFDSLEIAVLAGGDSPEREVSLLSGACCARALREAGHGATLLDPSEVDLAEIAWDQFDACFVALHGGAGEDGRIQHQLESLGVPYTGSGPEACRLAMSKATSKERFARAGVPTPRYRVLGRDLNAAACRRSLGDLKPPLVIKPDGQGSSLGVSLIESFDELTEALAQAGSYDDVLIVEQRIVGREFTVALIDRDVLPLIEIIVAEPFFNYHAKYLSPDCENVCEPPLADAVRARILDAATGAAETLGTSGLVRVDVMLDAQERAWVLEVNAVPGMTDHSLVPQAAAYQGIGMSELCDRLVRACMPMRMGR